MDKATLIDHYSLFRYSTRGIGGLVHQDMHDEVFRYLRQLDSTPITKVQLNQLLVISKAGSMSDGFFRYYWREVPQHTYNVKLVQYFDSRWVEPGDQVIFSHDHLRWGLYRLYIDGLLYFGNVTAAFNYLRSRSHEELVMFFRNKRFDSEAIAARGPSLPLQDIPKDDRYLISEMACKTFGEIPEDTAAARKYLLDALKNHRGSGALTFRQLLEGAREGQKEQLLLSYDEVLDTKLANEEELSKQFDTQLERFQAARRKAIQNTALYLSLVNDLDVYVATSMRSRKNFRDMATACEQIFADERLKHYHLRYFDPTMSAAKGHEDKGLIECLMVKCAKVLIYCEGEKESYGKDAEAAMALSLGKPVIFYCDHGKKTNFYKDVHPLARLIDFRSGVAVGAIVSDQVPQVAELVRRIFANEMEYRIQHHDNRAGYLKLIEALTSSVVRLQTDDELLTITFWNNYHNRQPQHYATLATGKEAERLRE